MDGRGRQSLIRDPRNGGAAVVQIEDPDNGSKIRQSYLPKDLEKEIKKRIYSIREKLRKQTSVWYERQGPRTTDSDKYLIDRVTPSPLPKGWKKSLSVSYEFDRESFQGQLPKKKLKIEIGKNLSLEGSLHQYAVKVKDLGHGRITISVDDSDKSYKQLKKLSEDLELKGKKYTFGLDFLIEYKD